MFFVFDSEGHCVTACKKKNQPNDIIGRNKNLEIVHVIGSYFSNFETAILEMKINFF